MAVCVCTQGMYNRCRKMNCLHSLYFLFFSINGEYNTSLQYDCQRCPRTRMFLNFLSLSQCKQRCASVLRQYFRHDSTVLHSCHFLYCFCFHRYRLLAYEASIARRQKKSGNLYYRFKASMLIKNQKSVIHHAIQLSGKSRSADTEKACQLMALQQDIGMLLHIFHDFFTQAVLH